MRCWSFLQLLLYLSSAACSTLKKDDMNLVDTTTSSSIRRRQQVLVTSTITNTASQSSLATAENDAKDEQQPPPPPLPEQQQSPHNLSPNPAVDTTTAAATTTPPGYGVSLGNFKDPKLIAWYAFVMVCFITPCICCLFCTINKYCDHRNEQLTMRAVERRQQLDYEISRIEHNVQIYSELEKFRRRKILQKTMKHCTVVLSDEDISLTKKNLDGLSVTEEAEIVDIETERSTTDNSCDDIVTADSSSTAADVSSSNHHDDSIATMNPYRNEISSGCRICLESFKAGDVIMHSMTYHDLKGGCRHLFHKECIISWLISQIRPVCPCCRQDFAILQPTTAASMSMSSTPSTTPNTSLHSEEQFAMALGIHDDLSSSDNETNASMVVVVANSPHHHHHEDDDDTVRHNNIHNIPMGDGSTIGNRSRCDTLSTK